MDLAIEELKELMVETRNQLRKLDERLGKINVPRIFVNQEVLLGLTELTTSVHDLKRIMIKEVKHHGEHQQQRAIPQACSNFMLPKWDEHLERLLANTELKRRPEKWIGIQTKEERLPPIHFHTFITRFLMYPQNCGFARKGNRYYYCCREGDHWDMEMDSKIYWEIVCRYCWHTYVEWWVQKDSVTDSKFVSFIRSELEEMENPLTKQYLYVVFGDYNPLINKRIKDILQDAYHNRNKSRN